MVLARSTKQALASKLSSEVKAVKKMPNYILSKSCHTQMSGERRTSARLRALERRMASRFLCVTRQGNPSVNNNKSADDHLDINKKMMPNEKKVCLWQRVVAGSSESDDKRMKAINSSEVTIGNKSGIITRSVSNGSVKNMGRLELRDDLEKISRKFLCRAKAPGNRCQGTDGCVTSHILPEKTRSSSLTPTKTTLKAADERGSSVSCYETNTREWVPYTLNGGLVIAGESLATDVSISTSSSDIPSQSVAAATNVSCDSSSLEPSCESSSYLVRQTAGELLQWPAIDNGEREVPETSVDKSDEKPISSPILPLSDTDKTIQQEHGASERWTSSFNVTQVSDEDASLWVDCGRSSVVQTPNSLVGFCWHASTTYAVRGTCTTVYALCSSLAEYNFRMAVELLSVSCSRREEGSVIYQTNLLH